MASFLTRRSFLTAMLAAALTLLALACAGTSSAGTRPNLLDRNLGIVIPHPHIHNLYWDNTWNTDNIFSRGTINTFTNALATSGYLDSASQYGVGSDSFAGSSTPATGNICGAKAPSVTHFGDINSWVSCMVTIGGAPIPALPEFGSAISDDLYIVYLPRTTHVDDTIVAPSINVLGHQIGGWTLVSKQSCSDYGAYHFLSTSVTGLFAYAVVPLECAATISQATQAASHEIVEAATDPAITLGWINNSLGLPTPRLTAGEAADACGTFRIVSGFSMARYWSNSNNGCRP